MRKNMIFVAAMLVTTVFTSDRVTSQAAPPILNSQHDQELIQKIQEGSNDAIEKAGNSGNRIFVPYLRQQKNKDHRGGSYGVLPIDPAAIALARLGETQELQEYWCMAITDDPKRGLRTPTEPLESVGGWFAIQALEKLLTPEGLIHWHKPTREEKESDTGVLSVHIQALITLPRVVPNPPPAPKSEVIWALTHTEERIKLWQDWIAAHKDELSKLQPTGEGVDFSPNACKNGKPVKKR
jgi:hypothetical protein